MTQNKYFFTILTLAEDVQKEEGTQELAVYDD